MKKIKELREEYNLTQNELAKKINATNKSIWAYENDIANPPIDTLIKLADVFSCTIDYLVGRTDELGLVKRENNALTAYENELLFNFRKLNSVNQNKVIGYCYALAN